jgi:REP element-mobilizing transposase RayT
VVNALILGVIGWAQRLYGMKIHCVVVMSNHAHLFLSPENHEQLESFQRFLGSNLSREVGREQGWRGGIFRGRYSSVNVTDEEEAQVGRLQYLLAHGVKEGLVKRPQDWPGVHAARELAKGKRVISGGVWIDRTAYFHARKAYESNRRSKNRRVRLQAPRKIDYTQNVDVELSPIPCWAHFTTKQYREAVVDLIQAIRGQHRELIERVPADWKKRILRRDPQPRPDRTKRSTRPLCHAASKEAWQKFRQGFKEFVDAYMRASDLLRRGYLEAIELFPPGCHLPRLNEEFRSAVEAPS